MHAPPPSMAASMYLLQEISKTHDSLRNAWDDVPDPESNGMLVLDDTKREPKAAIVDMSQLNDQENSGDQQKQQGESHGTPPCWEVALLAHHFHPSVAKFANDIGEIDYSGDPLNDFALSAFLDKFAYRNPKSSDKVAAASSSTPHNRRMNRLHTRLELPVNDPSFLEKADVNEQEEFFHRFFVERARRDELKGIKRNKHNKDDSSQDSVDVDQAFNAAEEAEVDGVGKSFEEYEANWETDEEEEAFVDSLAVKLMEDAAGVPADIDDDPDDLNDWGDMYEDEKDDSDGDEIKKLSKDEKEDTESSDDDDEDDSDDDVPNGTGKQADDDDEDAFMENDDSDDESASDSEEEPDLDESKIFGVMNENDSDDGDEVDDDDDNFGMTLLDEDESDDEQDDEIPTKRNKGKSKNIDSLPTFADAEEYEQMIEKSFQKVKRSAPDNDEDEEEVEENTTNQQKSKSSKKKKKKAKR
jgi:ribosome biogenesis protein MAK21